MAKILLALFILSLSLFSTPLQQIEINIIRLARYPLLHKETKKEIDCLADNIYHEAGREPFDGKVAVGMVTLNRVNSLGFADSICKVVKEKSKGKCQFTWHCTKKFPKIREELYNKARDVALLVYFNYGIIADTSQGALFYHADYVNPKWKNLEVTTQIGRHIFYKKKE